MKHFINGVEVFPETGLKPESALNIEFFDTDELIVKHINMIKEMLSPHLSVEEFEFSPTAIRFEVPNKMIPEHKENARQLALKVFEPIRAFRGAPIRINSGYRSLELNKRIGGSKSSQHMKGEAVDLPLTLDEAFYVINNLEWDQLIFEYPVNGKPSWVHVSYTTHKKNRKQVLIAVKQNGATKYLSYKGNEKLIYQG